MRNSNLGQILRIMRLVVHWLTTCKTEPPHTSERLQTQTPSPHAIQNQYTIDIEPHSPETHAVDAEPNAHSITTSTHRIFACVGHSNCDSLAP
ncbi:hypothetical protein KC19_5G110000 [Ceratodon purpureus]|uniref:Secreted protein n=1 Tax=Ceratodon purpureus TaxID=3225 RepID=A0A8T0I1L2_CERPU|nr:hypothetical protein KC19_5G110000 [Ceratodon purpureus]